MTTEADRRALLDLARQAVAARVAHQPLPSPPLVGPLARKGGAFVTLHLHKELRGCIGHIGEDEELGRVIPRCAAAACSEDPRFPPLTADELGNVDVELSLLGPLERIEGPDQIEIGRHGLVAELGWKRGLLLPQVAIEWGWDREAFLAHTCHKAGLPRDAWKQGATLYRFEAEVFGEASSSG
jgi:AmmeMemoRadiSam system protein A